MVFIPGKGVFPIYPDGQGAPSLPNAPYMRIGVQTSSTNDRDGLDILQSLQPEAANMQARKIKAEYGAKLSFHGGVSIQKIMPRATAAEVSAHISDLFKDLSPGAGYNASTSHNIQVDAPIRNVMALFDA